MRATDKVIMAAAEKLEEEVLAHAEIAIRLEESGVISTRAMKKLSEKHKLIQEQSRFIVKKLKLKQGRYGSCKGDEGGKKHEQEYELDQQNRALDAAVCDDVKKYIKSCKNQNRLSQI